MGNSSQLRNYTRPLRTHPKPNPSGSQPWNWPQPQSDQRETGGNNNFIAAKQKKRGLRTHQTKRACLPAWTSCSLHRRLGFFPATGSVLIHYSFCLATVHIDLEEAGRFARHRLAGPFRGCFPASSGLLG